MYLDQEAQDRSIEVALHWDPVKGEHWLHLSTFVDESLPKLTMVKLNPNIDLDEIVGCIGVTFATWFDHPAPVCHSMLKHGLEVLTDRARKR